MEVIALVESLLVAEVETGVDVKGVVVTVVEGLLTVVVCVLVVFDLVV